LYIFPADVSRWIKIPRRPVRRNWLIPACTHIKVILPKVDANTLTVDHASAIHEAFRQAGLRADPTTRDTIKAAGFVPDRLRGLVPPPLDRTKPKTSAA
jgi:hypothetical protein